MGERREGQDRCGLRLGGYARLMSLALFGVVPFDPSKRDLAGLSHRAICVVQIFFEYGQR